MIGDQYKGINSLNWDMGIELLSEPENGQVRFKFLCCTGHPESSMPVEELEYEWEQSEKRE